MEALHELIQVRDTLDEIFKEVYEKLDQVVSAVWYTTRNGEVITSWKGLQDEATKNEIAIKDLIKSSDNPQMVETKYFYAKPVISKEYDVEKLRDILGSQAEIYIKTKEVVDKTSLDKAVKKDEAPKDAVKALVVKDVRVSFIDKSKVKPTDFTVDL